MSENDRGAKAIYESRNGHGCKPWSLLTKSHKEPYIADFRAVLRAIREPTQLMIFEGNGHGSCEDADCVEIWQAMIDEALAEPE